MSNTETSTLSEYKESETRRSSYSDYKPTDFEWLGNIPQHWEIHRAEKWFSSNGDKVKPDEIEDIEVKHYSLPNIHEEGDGRIEDPDDISSQKKVLTGNEVLVSKLNPENGMVVLPDFNNHTAISSTEFVDMSTDDDILRRFGYYFYSSENVKQYLSSEAQSVTLSHKRVKPRVIQRIPFPEPPKEEQDAIVNFLDEETRNIDELIKKKEKLLSLLEEKRTAVVTDAVTQGLDSDAESRASGIPGLGQVPEEWELVPLKYSSRNISVGIVQKPSQYYVDEGVPALRSLNINKNEIVEDEFVFISEEANKELKSTQVYAGDLVTVRSGDPGTTAVVPEDLDGVNCIDLVIIREPDGYIPEFLSFLMNSEASMSQIEAGTEGAAQQHFNVEEVKELVFPKPSIEEQREILNWLSPRLNEIDELEEKIQEGIERLKEYRTTLITNAVTGQIDVRGEV